MSLRESFTASSASDNPAEESVPGVSASSVQFPVDDESIEVVKRDSRLLICCCYLSCVLGALPIGKPRLHPESEALAEYTSKYVSNVSCVWFYCVLLAVFFLTYALFEQLPLHLLSTRKRILWQLLAVVGAFVALIIKINWPVALAFVGGISAVMHAVFYREDYMHIASAGFLDPEGREKFRKYGTLPEGVTPGDAGDGYVDAWRLWASYNRNERSHPTFIQSLSGSALSRRATSCIICALLGHLVGWKVLVHWYDWQWPLLLTDGGMWPTAIIVGLAAAMWAVVPLLLYFYFLLLFTKSILAEAMGLRESAFSAARMDSFLDSQEFSAHVN